MKRSFLLFSLVCLFCSCDRFMGILGVVETVRGQFESPNKQLMLTWFERDSGATTRIGTSVALHRPDQKWDLTGADMLVIYGSHQLDIKWVDRANISIGCDDCEREDILMMQSVHEGLSIHYHFPKLSAFPIEIPVKP